MRLEWRDVAPGPAISTSLTSAETEELRRLARDKDVLEIGSAYGYSTVVLALSAFSVCAVDPHTGHDSLQALRSNLLAYRVSDRVVIRQARSQDVLPGLRRRFDLVWIDGDHSAEAVTHDVQWALKLLKPGGTLACHDYGEVTCPGVKIALDAWKAPPKLVDTMAIYGPGEW
jgi:predicted O-methyltransferase YrrM